MNLHTQHIAKLIHQHLLGELDAGGQRELDNWISSSDLNRALFQQLTDQRNVSAGLREMYAVDRASLQQKIEVLYPAMKSPAPAPVHRIHFLKTAWFRYAAAIIVLFGIGAYLWNSQQKEKPLITEIKPLPAKNDVPPGYNRAVLTLSDGKKVALDSAASETITDGTLSIKNIDGQLVYASGGTPATALPGERSEAGSSLPAGRQAGEGRASGSMIALNTMTTPKGGQYQLTLSDGTKVWLNAASSITYPTTFTNKTREVTITGEAYFEVKKNASKPFVVKTPNEDITVLGTHFNVNAYPDKSFAKTSLLEGSVKIGTIILKPGEAYVNGKTVSTDVQQDVAWKNGVFDFNNLTVQEAMKQLERWYDISVVYDNPVNEVFIGKVGRSLTLVQVLKTLDGLGVHFRLEGKTLHVFP